ncbi:MAG: hypothetical protein ACKVP7_23635 [Hyphomicrobiaceae bacterium]
MADGSGKPDVVLKEAEAAAAEAAREAKAEVLEKAARARPAKKHGNASRAVDSKKAWHEFIVDVWLTNLNSVEFGVYKHSRNKAKSRQFTSDMDIFAEVIENGERTGLLGYREDLWKKNEGMDKRLVFKLFNEGLNWRATMDLMIGRSLQLTLGARGLPVVAFSANIGDHDFMVYLERSANKWPLMPENYSFFIMDEGQPQFFRLKRDFINLGGDYKLINQRNQVIGDIDGSLFTLGGYWKGRIKTEYADARLVMVMQLFCAVLAFNNSVRRHVRTLSRDVTAGKFIPKLEKQEADLYMNPRRVR